jgi:peroxiredoxin Q/BCP
MTELKEGMAAPLFSGKDQDGKALRLEHFVGKKVILYFYPKDNTPGCTAESCNLRDNYADLAGKGYEVIGVSADSEQSHQKFITKYDLPFTLVSDPDKKILKAYGAWGMKKLYGKEYEGILRKTFVISENGMIMKVFNKVETKDHTAQILSELEK